MATRWFRKQDGGAAGPWSFQELAAMLRAGTIREDDRVRMEHGTKWIPARDVLGLLRAAGFAPTDDQMTIRAVEDEMTIRAAEDGLTIRPTAGEEVPSAEIAPGEIQNRKSKIHNAVYATVGLCVVAALATAVWALQSRPPIRQRDRTRAARAPRPETPPSPGWKKRSRGWFPASRRSRECTAQP
ncbi:MAG: DUF4339 domain-containing protein [Thermoguttaceae bacterium]